MAPRDSSLAVDPRTLSKIQGEILDCHNRTPTADAFLAGVALTLQLLDPAIKSYDTTHPSTISLKKSRPSATSSTVRADASTSTSSSAAAPHHPTSTSTLPTSPAADSLAATLAPLRSLLRRRNHRNLSPEALLQAAQELQDEIRHAYNDAESKAIGWHDKYQELAAKVRDVDKACRRKMGEEVDSDEHSDERSDSDEDDEEDEDLKPFLDDCSSSSQDDPFSSSPPAELPTPRLSCERLIPTRLFAPFLPSNSHTSNPTAPPFWLKGHQPARSTAIIAEDSEDDQPVRKKSKTEEKGKGKGDPRVVQEVEVEQETVLERMARLVQKRQMEQKIRAHELKTAADEARPRKFVEEYHNSVEVARTKREAGKERARLEKVKARIEQEEREQEEAALVAAEMREQEQIRRRSKRLRVA